jgi:hypothetical protein
MAFFKKKVDAESTSEYTGSGEGGKYINKSGMYPVNVIAPFVNQGNAKATTIDLFVNYNDQDQVIYGNMSYTNQDGSDNKIGQETFNKFVILADVDDVEDPVDAELPIGKKGAMKDAAVLEDLADVDVIVQVQMEYGVWNNNIKEKTVIKSFFRASDNASVQEIIAAEAGEEVEFGSQYATLAEGADFIKYKDGLDEERVQAWIKAKRPKGTGGGGAAATTTTKKPSFGKKKA